MDKKNRKYSREFKIETVRLGEEENRSVGEVAWLLGIHLKKLYKWHARFGKKGEALLLSSDILSGSDEELCRLRAENIRLREEFASIKECFVLLYSCVLHGQRSKRQIRFACKGQHASILL